MANTAYFIDWRPVACLPAHDPPICSPIQEATDFWNPPEVEPPGTSALRKRARPSTPTLQTLAEAAAQSLQYRWRDDGIVLFKLVLKSGFVTAKNSYFSKIATPLKELKAAELKMTALGPPKALLGIFPNKQRKCAIEELREAERRYAHMRRNLLDPLERAIDHVATRKIAGRRNRPDKNFFDRAVFEHLAKLASDYIKRDTGHRHNFHVGRRTGDHRGFAPTSLWRARLQALLRRLGPPKPSGDVRAIFVRMTPERVDLNERCTENGDDNENSFLNLICDDKELAKLKSTENGSDDVLVVPRPALFKLRQSFAAMHDRCIQILPNLKEAHLFSRIGRIKWPWSLLAIVLFAFVVVGLVALVVQFVVHGGVTLDLFVNRSARRAYFAATILTTLVYGAIEFGARRRWVLDALFRTAGVLQYGVVLGQVVASISKRAGMTRATAALESDFGHGPSIIARRLEMEKDRRDQNREMVTALVALGSLLFAVFGGFKDVFGETAGSGFKDPSPELRQTLLR